MDSSMVAARPQESLEAVAAAGPHALLASLPPEIIQNVFSWLNPDDLDPVSRVCRLFRDFIKENQTLCRDIYLLHLDSPPDNAKLNWVKEVRDLVKLERLFVSPETDSSNEANSLSFVCDTVDRLLQNATLSMDIEDGTFVSHNVERLYSIFKNEGVSHQLMQQSSLFDRMKKTGFHTVSRPPRERHQMSAKLHCLYGSPMMQAGRTRSARTYPYACSKVYDLRNYTTRTRWGPFRDDDTDRIDWEKLEAIMIVLCKNITYRWPGADVFNDVFHNPFFGSFSQSFRYQSGKENVPDFGDPELNEEDPYGVTGYWYRIVCFLDYSDFFHYNFSMDGLIPPHTPRPPLNVGEAARLIVLKIQVTSIEPPGEDDHPDWPVVHYAGDSRALDERVDDTGLSGIRGTVRTTKEGDVRWSSVSIFDGQERWRSEGIQVGGRKSARGVWGNWFDRDYDPHGPAGPTAFWKATETERPEAALATGLSGIIVDPKGQHPWIGEIAVDIETTGMDDMDFLHRDDDWEDDEDVDEADDEEWLETLRPILAEELPRLLTESEIGETELAFLRQQLGLE